MTEESKLSDDHPLMLAWNAYKATGSYENSFRWAAEETHRAGSMWAAFMAGWIAAMKARDEELDDKGLYKRYGMSSPKYP